MRGNYQSQLLETISPLLTDLYQLTMAQGYWLNGIDSRRAVYHLFFRQNPFNGGFTIACGIEPAIQYLTECFFSKEDLDYLATLKGADGAPLFKEEFLKYLETFKFSGDLDAVQEGMVVFPHEPIVRIEGKILECQLMETALLNIIGFQSLIATKATRVCLAAKGDPVIEFGLRRAQGINGAVAASRAAYIGGCIGTSNVLAGKLFGIPVKGTMAHSWVLAFPDEEESFIAFANAMPNNCIFLVDTYNTINGIKKAINAAQKLSNKGIKLLGIRLDSGDLAWLSKQARRLLNDAGLYDVKIIGSNDLDEYLIQSLKEQGATIDIWGVGTKLVTAYDQPALGCVYKLAMIQQPDGSWRHCIKLSEETGKVTIPGRLQVRRFELNNEYIGDAIYDLSYPLPSNWKIIDPTDPIRRKFIPEEAKAIDLLEPVIRSGKRIRPPCSLEEARERVQISLAKLHDGIKRFVNPHRYPAGVEKSLFERRQSLIEQLRNQQGDL